MKIPFNKPYLTGKEMHYMYQAVQSGQLSGNGTYTKKCHAFFEREFAIEKALLTTSCTDALEMAALLLNIEPGDEVIMPAYTFVSTANAFVLRGATIRFADSTAAHPNIDPAEIERLIGPRTKAIVVVHYAGVACRMEEILALSAHHGIPVVEDAAQAVFSRYRGVPLGSIGELAAFSFHETKNIISGEGGLLAVNNPALAPRSEIIWEKGTNRSAFFRGEVDKYGWVDIGSSFLPSEVTAAFLWSQLEHATVIQQRRISLWERYRTGLQSLATEEKLRLPFIPDYSTNNAHMFYVILPDLATRTDFITHLRSAGIHAVFHYLSLHKSPFFREKYTGPELVNCDHYADCLVRLPLFYDLQEEEVDQIITAIYRFFAGERQP